MDTKTGRPLPLAVATCEYETPELVFIDDASKVVLGVASGGFDGRFQMTEYAFEFEMDGYDE